MVVKLNPSLHELYEADETAWLDAMAERIARGHLAELDYEHLQEYLTDNAEHDRRSTRSRLISFLRLLLVWKYQPKRRTRKKHVALLRERFELEHDVAPGVLRHLAIDYLSEAYREAVSLAAIELGISCESFPHPCPWTIEQLLNDDLLGE